MSETSVTSGVVPPPANQQTTTPPPPNGQGSTTTPPPPAAAAGTAQWYDSIQELSADDKSWLANKKYKSPYDTIVAARSSEKLIGAPKDRIQVLPERFYDDAGKMTAEGRQVYERLGAVKDAKEYGLEKFVPKEGGDPQLMEAFSQMSHELALTKNQAEGLAKFWNGRQETLSAAQKAAAQTNLEKAQADLKQNWGADYDKNYQLAKEGALKYGLDVETLASIERASGGIKAMTFLANVGKSVGESNFVTGSRGTDVMDAQTAASRLQEVRKDKEFMGRVMKGDADAKAQYMRINEAAARGRVGE